MRILALDVGEKRIGVAISDPTETLAGSLMLLIRRNLRADLSAIAQILQQENAERVVVGLPLSLSGEAGPQAQAVFEFKAALARRLSVPVETWDERFSTREALAVLRAQGVKRRKQRKRVDAAAAAIILQSYLDAQLLPKASSVEHN